MAITCESILGHAGRLLVFILTAGGCACAAFAALTCEFFSYESLDASQLPPPYTNTSQGYVGLFGYYDQDQICQVYQYTFLNAAKHNVSVMVIVAQFAALVGPSCAAVAFLLNMVEWLFWDHSCTYFGAFCFLFVAFCCQGLTFMIYGERQFCFDDQISQGCKLELGAIYSIAASSAFYLASVVWCCMPRPPPICCSGTVEYYDDNNNTSINKQHNKTNTNNNTNSKNKRGGQTDHDNNMERGVVDNVPSSLDYDQPTASPSTANTNSWQEVDRPVDFNTSNNRQGGGGGGGSFQNDAPMGSWSETQQQQQQMLQQQQQVQQHQPQQYPQQQQQRQPPLQQSVVPEAHSSWNSAPLTPPPLQPQNPSYPAAVPPAVVQTGSFGGGSGDHPANWGTHQDTTAGTSTDPFENPFEDKP